MNLLSHVCQKGFRYQQNQRILNVLATSGKDEHVALHRQMKNCQSSMGVRREDQSAKLKMFALRCKSPFCSYCAPIRSFQYAEKLRKTLKRLGTRRCFFWTLTVPNCQAHELETTYQQLIKGLAYLFRKSFIKNNSRGRGRFIECVYDEKTGLYNLHAHLLVHMNQVNLHNNRVIKNTLAKDEDWASHFSQYLLNLDKKGYSVQSAFDKFHGNLNKGIIPTVLLSYFAKKSGLGSICDMRSVDMDSAKEISKYLTKTWEADDESLLEVTSQLKGKRTASFCGEFKNLEDDEEEDAPASTWLGTIPELVAKYYKDPENKENQEVIAFLVAEGYLEVQARDGLTDEYIEKHSHEKEFPDVHPYLPVQQHIQ